MTPYSSPPAPIWSAVPASSTCKPAPPPAPMHRSSSLDSTSTHGHCLSPNSATRATKRLSFLLSIKQSTDRQRALTQRARIQQYSPGTLSSTAGPVSETTGFVLASGDYNSRGNRDTGEWSRITRRKRGRNTVVTVSNKQQTKVPGKSRTKSCHRES